MDAAQSFLSFNLLARIWEALTRRIDRMLFVCALAIVGVGLVTLFSASDQSVPRVTSQLLSFGFAIVLMWIFANIPPQTLARAAVPLYVVAVLMLIGVAMFGVVVNGSRRWLNFGVARFQPSELMKIALPLMLAWYFQKFEGRIGWTDFALAAVLMLIGVAMFGVVVNGSRRWLNFGVARFQPSELMKIALPLMLAWYFQKFEGRIGWTDFALAAVLIVVPVYLIKRQPDLGTALLIAASGFYVLYLAGLSWKIMVGLVALGAALGPMVWQQLHDYQRERILTFLDPARDPLGTGYHSTQASIALGSGGVTGKGWLNGTQTHLDFLPERHTDFIFAVFGEEFGLIGNAVLLILYLLLIGRAMMIAANASTLFARLLAGAITLMFFTYAFVNMSMVSGLLPVVGVPLPLVSYGGTAMISLFIGLGVLMSVQAHRKLVAT